ncbi:heterokaryon incompatibility protein-domain-containing protein [Clohesyomyces aquaticus]|uniref:Heterokaryon incompatibility protein-domain-containing protein n=1 Tax=Clohesyomyces aquaticus TaxID=1231657 RepID=A0A1Y2A769_9PLEO|nr:heterokaryon incompatibility protein-domain-containing protein [Clohesyomyces aquaticus]
MDDPYLDAHLDLKSRGFRLLQVQPSEEGEPIRCTLQSYTLQDHPPYTALSYMWGENFRYDDIEINGAKMLARENLWCFLDKMRRQGCDKLLWIDAVCINQGKVHEVNHQVRMMRDIYSGAESVLIWLGEPDETSDLAMRTLAKRKPFTKGDIRKIWNAAQGWSVLKLCERQYWRRMWIIQEVILAKEAVIHCGSKEIEWCKFWQTFQDLQTISEHGRAIHNPSVQAILDSPAVDIVKMRASWEEGHIPLSVLLQTCGHHESTDIRDKVYALLGIANDGFDVEIDYQKSAKEILLDVFSHEGKSTVTFSDPEMESMIVRGNELPVYDCIFKFLKCSFSSKYKEDWKGHCRDHFGSDVEPPRSVTIQSGYAPNKRFDDGWTALDYILDHAVNNDGTLSIELNQDFYCMVHLWQKRLIDDLDLEELTVGLSGHHTLAMPPLTRTRRGNADATHWNGPVEICGVCLKELKRPILPSMDGFRRNSWDQSDDDCAKLQTEIADFLRKHRRSSEKAYDIWTSFHFWSPQQRTLRPELDRVRKSHGLDSSTIQELRLHCTSNMMEHEVNSPRSHLALRPRRLQGGWCTPANCSRFLGVDANAIQEQQRAQADKEWYATMPFSRQYQSNFYNGLKNPKLDIGPHDGLQPGDFS